MRRSRTRSRGVLRTFLSTGIGLPSQVARSIRVLQAHHSASTLPREASLLLTQGSMASSQHGAWCEWCSQWRAKGSLFCPICAAPIAGQNASYAATEVKAPWQQQRGRWHEWSDSSHTWSSVQPPHKRLSQSPRGRQGKGKDKKGKGKGAGKKGDAPISKGLLPPPPAPPLIPAPPAAPALPAPSTTSVAEQQLGTLVAALQAPKSDLPANVLQTLEGIAHKAAGQEAADLHRAVAQQHKAKKELAKVRAQRQTSTSAWAQYLKEVIETVTTQMDTQKSTISKLEEAEQQWVEALTKATADLSRLSDYKPTETIAEEHADEAPLDASAWEAHTKKRKALELEQQQQLLGSLVAASKSADSMAMAARREGSRTPRRQRIKEDTMDVSSSPELGPVKDKDHQRVPEGVQADGVTDREGDAVTSKPFA